MAGGIRILVVDDTADDREITVHQLRRNLLDNPIETCATGEEALERLQAPNEPPIDLLLLDARLPRMSGPETIAQIRQIPALSGLRIILLTALEPQLDETSRPDFVLEKPLQLKSLIRSLRSMGGFRLRIEAE